MNRFLAKRIIFLCLFALTTSALLSSNYLLTRGFDWLQISVISVAAVCRAPATQWIFVLCLDSYFAMFLIFEARTQGGISFFRFLNVNLWLAGLVLFALGDYALHYRTATSVMQVPVLLTGIVFGKTTSFLCRAGSTFLSVHRAIFVSMVLLAGAALWQPPFFSHFQYHAVTRWGGVFGNPNLYGLLMGTGVVLASSLAFVHWSSEFNKWRRIVSVSLCCFVTIVCGIGLVKSFSRGAWVATIITLLFFSLSWIQRLGYRNCGQPDAEFRFKVPLFIVHNLRSICIVIASLIVLLFWQVRFSEYLPVQRIVSMTNPADYSWRNRVAAWEGAIRMTAEKPLNGFGWGQTESTYQEKYLPSRLTDGAAVEMNDYLMLSASAGVPALICFVIYIWLSLTAKNTMQKVEISPPVNRHLSPQSVCRAGAIVLLAGFWFDGGLFKLPVGPIFWMLMELGRVESPVGDGATSPVASVETHKPKIGNRSRTTHIVSYGKMEMWLRCGAWSLAAIALLQSTVYLGTPFFPVSKRSLAIARKCLISPKETGDFDFLATNFIWRGRELKILLEHANLSNYNRELVKWQLDDAIYREYVLAPTIVQARDGTMNWRWALWENFYPRIRHETNSAVAAAIVLEQLHQRVIIVSPGPLTIDAMWRQKDADTEGFEALCVAAWRSVGIPAQLGADGRAEFFSYGKWQNAAAGE